jgi:RHS repeat-associated protein
MGRLYAIRQGVQTRSFTYDDLGRLLTETHPESGTTSYSYDANSNMVTKTSARGIVTTFTYDELNRVTQKSYSDGTPSVTYYYDTQPSGSPIATVNPVGRLTGVTRTVSGVTVSSYYSYCGCSSITEEATVINDGTPRTYITNYAYNLAGQLTTLTYPNGKIVSYMLDDNGRQTKVSSTYNNQPFDYIYSATYGGPAGQLTQVQYPILYYGGQRVQTLYTYAAQSGYMTHMQSYGLNFDYGYVPFQGPMIQDIWDLLNSNQSQHYEYDLWDRLTGYWQSADRDNDSSKIQFGYDLYNNVTSVGADTFTVASSTNRLTSRTYSGGTEYFTYDAAGNMTTMGTFDGENRLILSSQGASYMYDGNGRRFRTNDGNVVNYVYSYTGQLLTEDRITESASKNYIYFNGQVVAIHQQDDSVLFLFKDHLGSTRWVVTVSLPIYNWQAQVNWTGISGEFVYEPFGHTGNSSPTSMMFQGKERSGDLDYYGARYYDSRTIGISSMRWISADSVTSRLYDPPSLNKYTYVRNDPVNRIDRDGRWDEGIWGEDVSLGGGLVEIDLWTWVSPNGDGLSPYYLGTLSYWTRLSMGPSDLPNRGSGGGASDESDTQCTPDAQRFLGNLSIYEGMAKTLNTDANFLMALSALESGWNGQHSQDLHNLFGITNAGGPDLSFNSYQDSANYWVAQFGDRVSGDKTIGEFLDDLQNIGANRYNDKDPDWQTKIEGGILSNGKNTIGTYQSVLNDRKACKK